jgi:hypothetical protein
MAHALTRTLQKTLSGFLSTAVFLAAFAALGDILAAAAVAVATSIAQVVLTRSAGRPAGVLVWASLAVVVALTSLTLAGDDAFAVEPTPVHAGKSSSDCSCRPHPLLRLEAGAPAPRAS